MKKTALWGIAVLALLFVLSGVLDLYFTFIRPAPAADSLGEEIAAVDMLGAVRAGQIQQGRVVYRATGSDLADVTGVQTVEGKSTPVRTAMRLTDADLNLLRERRFIESDPVSAGKARKRAPRDYAAAAADGGTRIFGFALLLSIGLYVIHRATGARSGAFASSALRPCTSTVKFSSVAGCNEAKEEVSEIVEFLKDPARFRAAGGRMPKGVLLVGPPGTGKTMLAKAVAGEAKAHFYSLSGSDFVELYVGVGASRVRQLFKQARETAPSIIFIDEIDAVGRQRLSGESSAGNQEHEQTLNALLVAMDGFASDDAVIVFGATNRPETIDKALLRPGRFDRQVTVGLPDLRGRHEILKVHAGSVKLEAEVDLHEVAKSTPGFSGADLANLINEGALHAARNHRTSVTMTDLDEARDKISWGRENRRAMTDQDKKIIAYHEAGHALMQVLSADDALKLHKVTIIPRGQSLGSTQFMPQRDMLNYSQEQLIARLRCLMAGRIAEELAIGSITSGASGDIQEASRIARRMVFEWGMSPFGFMALSRPEGSEPLASQQTFHEAEGYVKSLLDENYRATTELLRNNRWALDAIAQALIERETITGDDVVRLATPAPVAAEPQAQRAAA